MPLQATSGAASYDGFGGGVAVVPTYIEDVFSTWLYTGNATTGQSINNGIDLATKGGLLWCKNRTTASTPHYLFDTARNFSYTNARSLNTATTDAQENQGTNFAKPETNGFSFGNGAGSSSPNINGAAFASWTFRKQPKFFDIVTWTGNSTVRTISHNLGSVPGCIIVKQTSAAGQSWYVYHRSIDITGGKVLILNLTNAALSNGDIFNSTLATSTEFTIGIDSAVNYAGATNVAYIFAHDAGGFGLTGTDNVISCGSWTGSTSSVNINLGYEPQWLLIRRTDDAADWFIFDVMRQMSYSNVAALNPNAANAEALQGAGYFQPTPTGFTVRNGWSTAGSNWIYMAIRRGPMKVPTLGTSVYNAVLATPTGSAATRSASITTDLLITTERGHALSGQTYVIDRLRGSSSSTANFLATQSTAAEAAGAGGITFSSPTNTDINDNLYPPSGITNPVVYWFFRRAPNFFDEVCYTGTGSATTFAHNLGVVPELMIVKKRSAATGGSVYSATIGNTQQLELFSGTGNSAAFVDTTQWNSTTPTSSVFTVGTNGGVNGSGATYVAYLFATCAGVSKVGSYTGTATTQTINCGFTAGARFVLIKRTDSTGDWYVWDSERGIVAGNDPYLLWNNGAPEITNTDYIDTASTGFEISSTAPAAINASGGTFIFLAIA